MDYRIPVCAYSAVQADGVSSIEVIVCNDGTAWTLTEDPTTKALVWSMDGVPPIPGTWYDIASAKGATA